MCLIYLILASAMEISSIPTFLFYFQCDLTQKMVGANEQQLKQNISDLAAKIGIKQQNNADQLNNQMQQLVLKFQIYDPSKQEFYQFKSGNLDVPIGKILDQLEVAQQKPDYYEIFQEFSQLKSFDKFVDQTKQYKLLVFMIKMINFESDSNFQLVLPSLDILRSFICDQKILKVLIEKHSDFIDTVFESLLCPDRSSSLQKGIKVLMLRFITNLFIDQEGVRYLSLKLDEIQIITDQFINHEFMTLNAITMIVYNMILVQNNLLLDQDYKQQLLEKILQIILNQQVNDDATFIAILYTILNIIYKNKGFIEFMNKYDLSPIKTKLSQSKDEKIGYALKDLKNVLDGKIN